MSDDKNNSRKPLKSDDYDDYNYDNFEEYDDDFKYEDYDDDYSLTSDDKPLTSARSAPAPADEKPLERVEKNRPPSRRETIKQVAEEQQNGTPRKPGVTLPDTRLTARNGNRNGNRRPAGQNERNHADRNTNNRRPNGRPPVNRSKFAPFYIALLFVSVCICLTVLVFLFRGVGDAWGRIPSVGTSPTPVPNDNYPTNREMRDITALITSIEPFTRAITLLDVDTQRELIYTLSTEARISDRNSRPWTFAELRVGDMVDVEYDSRSLDIYTLRGSSQAWERRSRTGVEINIDNFEITLGNDTWAFNSQTLVLYRNAPFSISQIRTIDSVTMRGVGDTVWLVQLDAAHGYLQLTNMNMITNGKIMIGNNLMFALEQIETDIELPEGIHRVMIEGDNIETFIEEVEIIQGQITRLNLGDTTPRAALINIAVTPEDADIFVNGELHVNTGPVQVEFGENIIRVEREGYYPQEQQLEITEPVSSIIFELTQVSTATESALVIFTVPSNAEIYIDHVFRGYSTLTLNLEPGTYYIIARMNGYYQSDLTITITGNETEDIMVPLTLLPNTSNPNDPYQNLPPPGDMTLPPTDTQPASSPTPPPTSLPTIPPGGQPTATPGGIQESPDEWWLIPPPGT